MLYYKKSMLMALSLLMGGSSFVSLAGGSADEAVYENLDDGSWGKAHRHIIEEQKHISPERDRSPVRSRTSKPQLDPMVEDFDIDHEESQSSGDQDSKKRTANERGETIENSSKKVKVSPDVTSDEGSPIVAKAPTNLNERLGLVLGFPQKDNGWDEFRQRIISYLPPEAQKNIALVCRTSFHAVLKYRMDTDPRKFQEKPWVQGPPVRSPELYRFNAAVFHALTYAIKLRSELQGQDLLEAQRVEKAIPISQAYAFLWEGFRQPYPDATFRVTSFLARAYPYIINDLPHGFTTHEPIRILAGSPQNERECELAEVGAFFSDPNHTPRQGVHAAGVEGNDEYLTPFQRFYWANTWRAEARIEFNARRYQRAAELFEKICKKTGVNATLNDYKEAARCHSQVLNFVRAYELCEEILKRAGDSATLNDYKEAALSHSQCRHPARAAELWEEGLKRDGDSATLDDYKEAARCHFRVGNFARAAELREEGLKRAEDSATLDDYKEAARCHSQVRNFARATELWEEGLKRAGDSATFNDYKCAAASHDEAQNFSRAAELYEEGLKRDGDSADISDYLVLANFYRHAQNFSRATELCEEVLNKAGEKAWPNYYRVAAFSHFQAKNFSRAVELYEEVLKRVGNNSTHSVYEYPPNHGVCEDAGYVHYFHVRNFSRAAELLLRVYRHPAAQMDDTKRIALFCTLHCDPHQYEKEREEILESGFLTDEEKKIYRSIFEKFSENQAATLQAIDEFVSNPANNDPKGSNINNIIYRIGFMLHSIAGNAEKADELKDKLEG